MNLTAKQRLTVNRFLAQGMLYRFAALRILMPPPRAQNLSFLTLAQAAEMLQVSKRTLLRMIQKNKMPALRVGGQWRIRESEFKKWVEQNETLTD